MGRKARSSPALLCFRVPLVCKLRRRKQGWVTAGDVKGELMKMIEGGGEREQKWATIMAVEKPKSHKPCALFVSPIFDSMACSKKENKRCGGANHVLGNAREEEEQLEALFSGSLDLGSAGYKRRRRGKRGWLLGLDYASKEKHQKGAVEVTCKGHDQVSEKEERVGGLGWPSWGGGERRLVWVYLRSSIWAWADVRGEGKEAEERKEARLGFTQNGPRFGGLFFLLLILI